ncbi:MAG: 6-carboxytetrahydropterin synthase QueD [Alphaproteobacteria bacterium]|jgi:6-pyruvoyltetrahydropterin/6-carboxytetrahydropterin synthase|nr:6-carboxytetrahydropterin synthase QueD [Alphaproteobacteria bacterium]|tara:strand:+ start:1056 stop:1427 length:372 start_codon:yes stop_codon:yes gene_type:complete
MNDIFEITKQFTFEAAHYFPNMPEGHIYKKIHGHSFVVEVTFSGKKNKDNQWVTDFDELSKSLNEIKKKLDHKCINDIKEIGIPSLENISSWIGKQLQKKYSNLCSIKLSRPSCGEYCLYKIK